MSSASISANHTANHYNSSPALTGPAFTGSTFTGSALAAGSRNSLSTSSPLQPSNSLSSTTRQVQPINSLSISSPLQPRNNGNGTSNNSSLSTATGILAPDIESPHWINVKDNGFGSLTGKIVVVNFWTYACHHSQSLLRHLAILQRTYRRRPVQVIGVHTPEFLFESDIDNLERAVRDFKINWPVAVDNDYDNFNRFGVRFWPSTILIDPAGRVAGRFVGAGSFPDLARTIHAILPN